MTYKLILAGTTAAVLGWSAAAHAAVVNYDDRAAFLGAVGATQSIEFSEVPLGTTLTNQYAGQGVTFVDGDDVTVTGPYANDGIGADGNGSFTIAFDSLITAVGFGFPGALQIELFDGVTSVGLSDEFGQSGQGFFGGVVSDIAFDRIVVTDWFEGNAFVGDMVWAADMEPIPLPAGLLLLATGLGVLGLRRRTTA